MRAHQPKHAQVEARLCRRVTRRPPARRQQLVRAASAGHVLLERLAARHAGKLRQERVIGREQAVQPAAQK